MLIPLLISDDCLYVGNNLIIVPHNLDVHINYYDAELFASLFNRGKFYDGWRLPTHQELRYLLEINQYLPPIYRHRPGLYWASNYCQDNNEQIIVNMGFLKNVDRGSILYRQKNKFYDVRMLRSLNYDNS